MTVVRVDQGMAAAAVRALPARVDKDQRTRYKQLRVMLHTAGLAAAYAFIASKAGDQDGTGTEGAYRKAADGIRDRLAELNLLSGDAQTLGVRDVLGQLGEMDPVRYARASAEATAFAGWLSRLADAAYQEENGAAAEGGDDAS
jgi:CRISPR/Cas system CMR-associated protein Cmr5 small subunit